jgi:hypothetical protein
VLGSVSAAVSAQPPAAFAEAGLGAERSELSLRRADAASLASRDPVESIYLPRKQAAGSACLHDLSTSLNRRLPEQYLP